MLVCSEKRNKIQNPNLLEYEYEVVLIKKQYIYTLEIFPFNASNTNQATWLTDLQVKKLLYSKLYSIYRCVLGFIFGFELKQVV